MSDFKERLNQEREELTKRLENLNHFIGSIRFYELSEEHQNLLIIQSNTMRSYYNVLGARQQLLEQENIQNQ